MLMKCEEGLKRHPEDATLWNNKGWAHLDGFGQRDEALAAFTRAIEIAPNTPMFWDNQGEALEKLGRDDEAKVCYDRAQELKREASN